MADNSTLPAVGDVVASDDIGGVKFQRVKLIHGVDNVNNGDVARNNGFPVMLAPASVASRSVVTSVSASVTTTVLLAAQEGLRTGATIYNDSTAVLYVLLGEGVASTTKFSVKLAPGGLATLGPGDYAGVVSGIWGVANGAARITEFYVQ